MTEIGSTEPTLAADSPPFTVSARAAERIAEILAAENGAGRVLRVSVSGGGCAGFQYVFDFDDGPEDDDIVIERDGTRVVVDQTSLGFLAGAELDFVENLIGAFFAVKNPNAASSCGCGTSFSV